MRTLGLVVIAITGLGLSGCSQVSSIFGKKKPHYHTTDGTAVYADETLRTTPQQTYQFSDQSYDVDVYNGASQYAGYGVDLYNSPATYQPAYVPPPFADPRDTEFVKLNGNSEVADWQNCETMSRGYLYVSEYDFRLDPEFEVCMRNKGYVLTPENGPTTKQILTARTAGLRGVYQSSTPSYSTPSYSYPGSYESSTSSLGYAGY